MKIHKSDGNCIIPNKPQIPHISIMFARICIRAAVSLVIILKVFENTIKKLPNYYQMNVYEKANLLPKQSENVQ